MTKQKLHTVLVGFTILSIYGASAKADEPKATDRPGRATAAELVPDDDELLQQTAKQLEVSTTQPIDQQLINVFGLRQKAAEYGLSIDTAWTIDYSKSLRGGANTEGDSVRHLFDQRFNLDTSAAFNWDGGTFSLDFQNQTGTNGTDDLGDLQGYDNADADGRTQISELWYQQVLFDDKLRVKVGKVDSNSEFAFPENASMFINSSFGHSPTVLGMPTYPDPSTSLNIFVYPTAALYAGLGIYDGSGQRGTATGAYGPARLWHGSHDLFYIGEAGYRWQCRDQTLPGRLAVGGHYHDGDFDKFNGGTQSGAGGFYVNVDQKLHHKRFYNKGDADGVYAFLQYGHADGNVSEVTDFFGAGLTWVGPFDKENPDTVGLAVASAKLTDEDGAGFSKKYETSVEAFYNFQVTPYFSVKPDLQYIFNPGGDASLDNALVLTIRLTVAF